MLKYWREWPKSVEVSLYHAVPAVRETLIMVAHSRTRCRYIHRMEIMAVNGHSAWHLIRSWLSSEPQGATSRALVFLIRLPSVEQEGWGWGGHVGDNWGCRSYISWKGELTDPANSVYVFCFSIPHFPLATFTVHRYLNRLAFYVI